MFGIGDEAAATQCLQKSYFVFISKHREMENLNWLCSLLLCTESAAAAQRRSEMQDSDFKRKVAVAMTTQGASSILTTGNWLPPDDHKLEGVTWEPGVCESLCWCVCARVCESCWFLL